MSAHQRAQEKAAEQLGRTIGGQLPPGVGFCLLLFSFADDWTTYISSGDRAGTIAAIRQLADKLEAEGGN